MPKTAKTCVLACRVSTADADAFAALGHRVGAPKPSSFLAALVGQALDQSRSTGVTPEPVGTVAAATPRPGGPRRLIGTRIGLGDHEAVLKLAAPYGGVSAWLRGLVEASLGRATERPAREEIEALNQATVQLWHAATNINQIARHMNEARLAGQPVPVGRLEPEALEHLRASFERLAEANTQVIAAGRRRSLNRG